MKAVEELYGKNIVVYDLEIKKTIEQCSKGWASFDEMGISVGCAFDYRTMRFRVFLDDNVAELVNRLNEASTLIVAFNHLAFDNKLLRATPGLPKLKGDEELNNYDMMKVSREALGLKGIAHKGFKLDDHLEACGLAKKTANGAEAPLMWQAGKVGELVDYCLNDVTVERSLFEDMWVKGTTASAYRPIRYKVELPSL